MPVPVLAGVRDVRSVGGAGMAKGRMNGIWTGRLEKNLPGKLPHCKAICGRGPLRPTLRVCFLFSVLTLASGCGGGQILLKGMNTGL